MHALLLIYVTFSIDNKILFPIILIKSRLLSFQATFPLFYHL